MPKNCYECNFAVDGLCVAMQPERSRDWKAKETTNYCPLTEYETTDQITLKAALDDKAFRVFSMVAAADPLKPINMKMTYWQLFEIVKMLKEGKNGK